MTFGLAILMLTNTVLNVQNPPAPASTPQAQVPAAPVTGFLFKSLTVGKETYAYSVYVPPEYDPRRPWPAILFLHGSGERGSDGLLQSEVGIANAIRRNRALCPAIVVMPQCRSNELWTRQMAELAMRCLDQTTRDYAIDPDRIYLTGLSMGGFGAWLLGERAAERFAAVIPICGFYGSPQQPSDPETLAQIARSLRNMPVWCFHGALDPAVSVERSREIVGALRAAGGNVKYTEFADGQHDVWTRVYADANVWSWMLAQRRAGVNAPASKPAP
jgi:predicted peptidase